MPVEEFKGKIPEFDLRDCTEIISFRLYDTVELNGKTRSNLFCIPMGNEGKTQCDTNMFMAGVLPIPQKFVVSKMEVLLLKHGAPVPLNYSYSMGSDGIGDPEPLWSHITAEFQLQSKSYDTQPIIRYADPVCVVLSGNILRDEKLQKFLEESRGVDFKEEICIDQGCYFTVRLDADEEAMKTLSKERGPKIYARVSLIGKLYRPVC